MLGLSLRDSLDALAAHYCEQCLSKRFARTLSRCCMEGRSCNRCADSRASTATERSRPLGFRRLGFQSLGFTDALADPLHNEIASRRDQSRRAQAVRSAAPSNDQETCADAALSIPCRRTTMTATVSHSIVVRSRRECGASDASDWNGLHPLVSQRLGAHVWQTSDSYETDPPPEGLLLRAAGVVVITLDGAATCYPGHTPHAPSSAAKSAPFTMPS